MGDNNVKVWIIKSLKVRNCNINTQQNRDHSFIQIMLNPDWCPVELRPLQITDKIINVLCEITTNVVTFGRMLCVLAGDQHS